MVGSLGAAVPNARGIWEHRLTRAHLRIYQGGEVVKGVGVLVEVGRGEFGVREEFVPATVAPAGFQAHEGLVTGGGPELAGAFETTLILAAGRFDGA